MTEDQDSTEAKQDNPGVAPVIQLRDLRHRYGETEVLFVDHWTVTAGDHTVIVGPSGSGKTTLLSILTGLLKPTSGDVTILDQPLTMLKPSERDDFRARNFGIVFQDNHLISNLTVAQNIHMAQKIATGWVDADYAASLLDQFGLSDRSAANPTELSRGEAQRVAILCAAVSQPKLLIADEPTSALDDANTERVIALLTDMAEKTQATLLVASHDARLKSFFSQQLSLPQKSGEQASQEGDSA